MTTHKPVLLKEVLEYLNPKPNENFIDCTVGEGGHTIAILAKNEPTGKVLGIDWDESQIESCRIYGAEFKTRLVLENNSYINIKEVAGRHGFLSADGILVDLGMSSRQLELSKKGFSFLKDEPLDMRYDVRSGLTAEKIINKYTKEQIEKILEDYGEEKYARQIAQKIYEVRQKNPIKTKFELVDVIAGAIPTFAHRQGRGLSIWAKAQIGARTFQALRIAVNGELDNLINFLPQALEVLRKDGRLVIISFHSLEDRIVKQFFKNKEREEIINILTKKPVTASKEEITQNNRSRSAKLRAIVKI